MNKIRLVNVLRSDARVRPSDAGADFARHLLEQGMLDGPLECDLRGTPPGVLISAFFLNFMEALFQEAGTDAIRKALEHIKWVAEYDFQSNNIVNWLAPYKDKLETGVAPSHMLSLPDRLMVNQKEKEEIMRQFRLCAFWKALQKLIEDSHAEETGIVNTHDGLVHHRGTGAFSLKKVYAYPAGAEDPQNALRFCFSVSCWDDEYEQEVDADVMIDAPLQLVIDFDQELFDEWAKEKAQAQREIELKRARDQVMKLHEKYPELREAPDESE